MVFVDTSFLIAFLRTRDQFHERAHRWAKRLSGELLSTDYVRMELVDAFSHPSLRRRAMHALASLRSNPRLRILTASRLLMDEGLGVFEQQADKAWSLTDCISFSVIRGHGIHEALTTDHHFEQAGFRALLRSNPP